jgi:hypothetical protein
LNEQFQPGAAPGNDPQVQWVPVVQGDANHCELCGRGPAKKLWLRSFVGMLILTRIYSDHRWLCREHGIQLARAHLLKTCTVGWFSFMSLLANVIVIPADIIGLVRARSLPEPGGLPVQQEPAIQQAPSA